MKQWKTVLFLHHKNGTVQSDDIKINSGIFQGDCPSGIFFCLALAPLSWLINRTGLGYKIGKGKEKNNVISHLLLMDDLKLYASNDNQLKTLLETVKTFSKNIGMAFG